MNKKYKTIKLFGIICIILSGGIVSYCQMSAEYISVHGVSNHNLTEGSVLISNDKLGNTYQAGVFGGSFVSNYKLGNITIDGSSFVNGYLSKLNSQNQIEWALKIGGNNQLIFRFMEIDSKGNIFICGSFRGSVDFNPDPMVTKSVSGSTTNITNFILKLDKNGTFVWVTTFGGVSWNTIGEALAIDKNDNIIVAGTFLNTFYYGSFSMSSPDQLLYCIKVNNSDGKLLWAKKYVTTYNNFNMDISVDKTNNIFILSQFSHTIDIDLGPPQKFVGAIGKNDVYVVKLSSEGVYAMFKNFRLAEEQTAKVLMHDNDDNIIVIYKSVISENTGQFEHRIEKYSKDMGGILWSKSIPAGNITDATFNKYYDIVCVGDFGASTSYDPANSKYKVFGNGKAFVYKVSNNGIFLSEIILNTTGVIKPYQIKFSPTNQISVAGFILGKAYFNPSDSTNFNSNDNKIENFIFRWNDMCGPIYYTNETLHACAPFTYKDSLILYTGNYSILGANKDGCLVENKLTATVSNLQANIIATEDSIFTTELNAKEYLWYECNSQNLPVATNSNVYIPNGAGHYTLVVNDNYCSDSSDVCIGFPQISLMAETGSKNFGKIVRLNKNGFGFAAYNENNLNGKINIYKISEDNNWNLSQTIDSPSGFNKSFGYEMSSYGNLLLISEKNEVDKGGLCYLYQLQNNQFIFTAILKNHENLPDQSFGNKTDIYNDLIVVSASGDGNKKSISNNGQVQVFKYESGEAKFVLEINQPEGDNAEGFGSDIAITEKYVFVSSPQIKTANDLQGVIYVYKVADAGNTFSLSEKLHNLQGIKDFGKNIACSKQYLCISGENQMSMYKNIQDRWLYSYKLNSENLSTINDLSIHQDKVVYSCYSPISNVVIHDLSTGFSEQIPIKNSTVSLTSNNFFLDMDERFIMIGIPEFDIYGIDNGLVYVHQYNSISETTHSVPDFANIKIYPNPATDYITIEENNLIISNVCILDITGKILLTTEKLKIDVGFLPPGLFFLTLTYKGNHTFTSKIIKK